MKNGRRRVISVVLIMVMLSMLTGCADKKSETQSPYSIYCINSTEDELMKEPLTLNSNTRDGILVEMLSALSKDPSNKLFKRSIPEHVSIESYELEGEKLTLQMSSTYSEVTGVKEILCRAAIVKTLCQADGVNYVRFLVNGEPLVVGNDKTIGFMSAEDFVDNTSEETTYKQNTSVSLYFANESGNRLVEIPLRITFDGSITLEQLVLEQLIKGPAAIDGIDKEQIESTLPEDTKINKLIVKNNICYVDFDKPFFELSNRCTKEVVIYSVVNSLAELSTVNKVQITVDGKALNTVWEDVPEDGQFERNLDIVKQ